MSAEELAELGREYVELSRWNGKIYEELLQAGHALVRGIEATGRKSVRIDDTVLRIVPGRSPRLSPSSRRRVRKVIGFGPLLGPHDQPKRVVVETVRNG